MPLLDHVNACGLQMEFRKRQGLTLPFPTCRLKSNCDNSKDYRFEQLFSETVKLVVRGGKTRLEPRSAELGGEKSKRRHGGGLSNQGHGCSSHSAAVLVSL